MTIADNICLADIGYAARPIDLKLDEYWDDDENSAVANTCRINTVITDLRSTGQKFSPKGRSKINLTKLKLAALCTDPRLARRQNNGKSQNLTFTRPALGRPTRIDRRER